jgi:hypothetical protein
VARAEAGHTTRKWGAGRVQAAEPISIVERRPEFEPPWDAVFERGSG